MELGDKNRWSRIHRIVSEWSNILFKFYVLRKTPILLYSLGGSGTNSIVDALHARGALVLHTHMLTDEALSPDRHKPYRWRWIRRNVIDSKRPVKVIAMVRDPIATKVSGFFMKSPKFQRRAADSGTVLTVDDLLARFLEYNAQSSFKANFFEREIEPILGIDVYAQPFPHEQGFLQYRRATYELLVLRSEVPDERKGEIIGAFTGFNKLAIGRSNQSEDKAYAGLRRQFDERLTISDEVLDFNYGTRFAQHFFSAQELASLRAKWKK